MRTGPIIDNDPLHSDTVLVDSSYFNDRGEGYLTQDPAGTYTCLILDDAGRKTGRVKGVRNQIQLLVPDTFYPASEVAAIERRNQDRDRARWRDDVCE